MDVQSPSVQRDRSRRGDRGTRFSDVDEGRDRSETRICKRIYVSNIPYEFRWQDLKDLFRRVVGTVEFVEMFMDESGKARGCGIVEFKDPESVQKAMEKMNRYELNGREIVVKEDHGEVRDKFGRIGSNAKSGGDGTGSHHGGNSGGGGGRNSLGGSMRGGRNRDRDDDRNNYMLVSSLVVLHLSYFIPPPPKKNLSIFEMVQWNNYYRAVGFPLWLYVVCSYSLQLMCYTYSVPQMSLLCALLLCLLGSRFLYQNFFLKMCKFH